MKVSFRIEGQNGCALYRLQIPAKYLVRNGVQVRVVENLNDGDIRDSDIIVFQKANSQQLLDQLRRCKELGAKIVYECDDDYFNIPVWNPAHNYYKTLRPVLESFLKEADLVTVSTHHLRSQFKSFNNNITVLPNSIDFEGFGDVQQGLRHLSPLTKDCEKIKVADFKNRIQNKTVIGWLGSPTHKKDLNLLVRVLGRVANQFPNVVFLFGGCVTAEIARTISKNQIYFLEMVPPAVYFSYLQSLELDIGLAPLDNHIFNHSKSNLKVIEYMSSGAVPVASNMFDNYGQTIKHGETGYVCNSDNDWYDALTALIQSPKLRRSMREACLDFVRQRYDIDKNISMWQRAYATLVEIPNEQALQTSQI